MKNSGSWLRLWLTFIFFSMCFLPGFFNPKTIFETCENYEIFIQFQFQIAISLDLKALLQSL
jgi:hypothetical protein